MVIFGPFGNIEPLCTSSNQNNSQTVPFNWTNYFILSLIDILSVLLKVFKVISTTKTIFANRDYLLFWSFKIEFSVVNFTTVTNVYCKDLFISF